MDSLLHGLSMLLGFFMIATCVIWETYMKSWRTYSKLHNGQFCMDFALDAVNDPENVLFIKKYNLCTFTSTNFDFSTSY
jgi:hypothetical protein